MSELLRAKHRIVNRTNSSRGVFDTGLIDNPPPFRKFDLTRVVHATSSIRPESPVQSPNEDELPSFPNSGYFGNQSRRYAHQSQHQSTSPIDYYVSVQERQNSPLDSSQIISRHKQSFLTVGEEAQRHIGIITRQNYSPYKPKQCLVEYVHKQLVQIAGSGQTFVDSDFPPNETSLFSRRNQYIDGIKFERMSRMGLKFGDDLELPTDPSWLKEGHFSQPYFSSALQILSQFPHLTAGIAEGSLANGCFTIRLNREGVWRYISIDDFVPVRSIPRQALMNTHSVDKDGTHWLGIILVEKAITKMIGTMFDFHSFPLRSCSLFLKFLTGCPIGNIPITKDFKSYLVGIDMALRQNHIPILENLLPEVEHHFIKKGIRKGESYRIIELKKNGLVLLNKHSLDNMTTVIGYDDCQSFGTLLIVKTFPRAHYIGYTLRHKHGYYSKLKITVEQLTRCYFEVSHRIIAKLRSNRAVEALPFSIMIDGAPEAITQPGKEIELEPGEYQLRVHLCGTEQDFTVSVYSDGPCKLQRLENKDSLWSKPCSCE